MARPDRYDYIGMALLALVVALWIAHFVLPTPPPEQDTNPPQARPVFPTSR
jgi:hypothetical protein